LARTRNDLDEPARLGKPLGKDGALGALEVGKSDNYPNAGMEASLRRNSHFARVYRELHHVQSPSILEASDRYLCHWGSRGTMGRLIADQVSPRDPVPPDAAGPFGAANT